MSKTNKQTKKESPKPTKRAIEALKESETHYRRFFETAQDGILILDGDTGQINDVNPFLAEMLGYSGEEFIGKRLWEVGFFKDKEASKQVFQELQEKSYVRYDDLTLETKDGRRLDVEFVSNVYLVHSKRRIQCNIRDITGRVRLHEASRHALVESQQRQAEVTALLAGSRAVLEQREFQDAARSIFDSCKSLIGATAGYIA